MDIDRRTFLVSSASAAAWLGLGRFAPAETAWKYPNRGAEVVAESGLPTRELEALLDRIAAETADRPFVVTKTRQLAAIADKARLAVAPNDVFIDWFPDTWLLTKRRAARVAAFARTRPELAPTVKWLQGVNGGFVSCLDTSHTCPDWESVLSLGLRGIEERARTRRKTATTDDERLFLDAVADTYAALVRMCRRWAEVAERRGATACAATLREIAAHEPRTLREALQLMLFYDRAQETDGECVRSQGLFDRLYIRFYEADLAAGRETRESAKALVGAMFDKFLLQHHPNGKNIALGGYGRDGRPVWNALTEIAFELHYERNTYNPKFTYRYGAKTPREQLAKVAKCLAAGRTSVVLFNEEVAREMYVRRGKDPADTAEAVLIGCYEPGIQGREIIASMSAWVNLVKPLEAALNGGRDFKGFPVGPACGLPADYPAFEAEYLRQLGALADRALGLSCVYERNWYDLNPSPVLSGACRDAIANAKDAGAGGLKYNQSGVMCAGLGTVADSLAAVRYLVDEAKLVTMAELAAILKADWKGHEDLRLKASRVPPKWGNGDARADLLAKTVFDALSARVNRTPNGHGGTFQAGFWSIDNDLRLGQFTAATPDGRLAGKSLSRNNVATAGCGKEGPTALVASCAKLDQANSPDGFVIDVILPASARDDGSAAERIVDFLTTAGSLGAQCINLNCFNSKVLRDAQAHPEKYPDLQVRVCGWNVRWNDLSRAEQDHFIATASAQE